MKQRGFTLVELLVVITMMGILVVLAVPSFTSFLARRSVSSAIGDLAADFRYARTLALQRSMAIGICRSSDGATCATSGSWSDGWIIFEDWTPTVPPAVATGDKIVRVHGPTGGVSSIHSITGASATPTGVSFRAGGMATGAGANLVFTPQASSSAGTRLMCISFQGRASVRDAGATVCN